MADSSPVDPDVDVAVEGTWRTGELPVLGAVIAGGVLGAVARYEAGLVWPTRPGHFPWTTFGINVAGCALIGVLMVLVAEVVPARRLVRPFIGTGILGGFTTFSTYAVDIHKLVTGDHAALALTYLVGTVVAAVLAVAAATRLTRLAVRAVRAVRR